MSNRNRLNMPDNHEPPVPAWAADWSGVATSITSGFFAIQGDLTDEFIAWARHALYAVDFAPEQVERAQFTDREGIENHVFIGYWRDQAYQNWWALNAVSDWWASDDRLSDTPLWREVYSNPVDRIETLHSSDNSHGMANMSGELEGPIDEHMYAGGARDRIQITGSEDVTGPASISYDMPQQVSACGKRITVFPPDKMCVIRSGQDWGYCDQPETEFYLETVHPTLIEGMDYLSENPAESRCLSMRLMENVGASGGPIKQTFGLGYALDIFAFEEWAKSHPTHLKIFGNFMTHAQRFPDLKLRLWHEVSILQAGSGDFEYINCHKKTGLLPYC